MHTTGSSETTARAGPGGGKEPSAREALRLEARLEAFADLRAEIEPWLMEEREVAGREALANVLFHLDAEIAEQHRRLEDIDRPTQASD